MLNWLFWQRCSTFLGSSVTHYAPEKIEKHVTALRRCQTSIGPTDKELATKPISQEMTIPLQISPSGSLVHGRSGLRYKIGLQEFSDVKEYKHSKLG